MADPLVITMAGFLTLAAQCGSGIAPQTLADLQAHESGFNTIAININGPGGGTVKNVKTRAQAVALAKSLYAKKINFDAGLPQINSGNFEWLGLTPETVFEPCEAIKAQVRYLRSLSKYNTGSEERGFKNGYVNKVIGKQASVREAMQAVWSGGDASLPLPPAVPPAAPGKPACAVTAPDWDSGGRLRQVALCNAQSQKRRIEEYP
jgi:type IV secretion system protein VirB1